MLKRWLLTFSIAAICLSRFAGAAPQTPASSSRVTVTHPYVGVTLIDRAETSPRAIHAHIVQLDLAAGGIRFMLSPHAGDRETVRETTAEFVREQHAQFGVNVHFFLPFPSTDKTAFLIGLAASEGHVFSAFENPEQSFAIVANAPALNIDDANHATFVHRDPAYTDGMHVLEPVELWTTVSGSAQIVTQGKASVPVYKDAQHPDGLLTIGGPKPYDNTNSWYDVHTARSAIGISGDGRTLTIFTVDVRGGSDGMSVPEVARMLVADYGIVDALNLDGGGSTSLAMADPATGTVSLINMSSDNPAGRSVGSSLAVFARVR